MCSSVSVSVCVCVLLLLEAVSLYSGAEATNILGRYKRQSSCARNQFQCADRTQCIKTYDVCDGKKDCADGSDETKTQCNHVCPSLSFQCAYGACIDKDLQCNGEQNCVDGSDEIGCTGNGSPSSSSNCGSRKFRCSDGSCISGYLVCDGTADCTDGSDETKELCKSFPCPSSSFKCEYGGCLDGSARCNGVRDCWDGSDEIGCPGGSLVPPDDVSNPGTLPVPPGGCRLPDKPAHGVYSTLSCQSSQQSPACRNKPGTPVTLGWNLLYSCDPDYTPTTRESTFSTCSNGSWIPNIDCIKLCRPLKSLSVAVTCSLNGEEVNCDQPMKPDTVAKVKCRENYQLFPLPFSSMVCKNGGEWSNSLFSCSPVCGYSNEAGLAEGLVSFGTKTKHGQFPWLVALYMRNKTDQWEQSCGGTLITPHIVLTAAHCVVFSNILISTDNITVGLGKYYRDYYQNEEHSKLVPVREILLPKYYSGLKTNYALDIAMIDLVETVQVTNFIRPVCVDWENTLPVKPATKGHVAGWGRTENQIGSNEVLYATMSYLENTACINKIKRNELHRFVTHDKFCAEDISSGLVERGDSGGGMTFVYNSLHYIFGVVSTKVEGLPTLRLFTDLKNAEHSAWLTNTKITLEKNHSEQ